jgi:tetratricopeptide (TPR) repeat protein
MDSALDMAAAVDRSEYRLGLLALRDGDLEGAIRLLARAVASHPLDAGMRRTLVRALLAGGQFARVLEEAPLALAGAPDDPDLLYALGTALSGVGQPARACAVFARAVGLKPDHAGCWLNFGNAAMDLERLEAAEARYRSAIRFDPGLAEAHASLGCVLARVGRLEEAIGACEAAIGLRPDFAQAHMNLATALLLGGDFERGFAEYEWRKRIERHRRDFAALEGPEWDGGAVRGRTILVRAEQGLGDAIQCARYLRLMAEAGGKPVLVCAAGLVPLIRSMPGVESVALGGALPAYDAWVDLMSLPGLFGTRVGSIPLASGYLAADADRVRAWRGRLPAGRKVGVVFAGNPDHPADRLRSIGVERLPAVRGVRFVSLRHGEGADWLGLENLTQWMTDYAETAALVAQLDLVVTVDTSVAHLAGALGRPAWVLLPFAPDWRWMLGRDDSPWYGSVRLFRQERAGDWGGVLERVAAGLAGGGW